LPARGFPLGALICIESWKMGGERFYAAALVFPFRRNVACRS